MLSYRVIVTRTLLYIVWILSLFITLFPIAWVVSTSLKNHLQTVAYPPVWIFAPTLHNYALVLSNGLFPHTLLNSVFVVTISVVVAMVFGIPAAYAIARSRRAVTRALFPWALFLRLMPGIIFIIPMFIAYRVIGWLGTYQALIVMYVIFDLPLVVSVLAAFVRAFPLALEEAAWVEGATTTQVLRHIVVPLIMPGLLAAAVLAFVLTWGDFLFALLLTNTQTETAPVSVLNFIMFNGIEWGQLSAATTLLMAPVIVFGMIFQRYLVRGLTTGAVRD